jgi:hypothetical protein
MILQVRMRLQHGISLLAGPATVQLNHDRLGFAAPLYSVAWMLNGIKLEMLGIQASSSNPPYGIFYSEPGGPKPISHKVDCRRHLRLHQLDKGPKKTCPSYLFLTDDR